MTVSRLSTPQPSKSAITDRSSSMKRMTPRGSKGESARRRARGWRRAPRTARRITINAS
jgi:hypothetical protein